MTDGIDGIIVDENSEDAFVSRLQELMNNQAKRENLKKGRLNKLVKYSPIEVSLLWNNLLIKIKRDA